MADQPYFALLVSDVAASSAFFTEKLGFTLTAQKLDKDLAYLLDTDGDPLLLAGPSVKDPTSYLAEPHLILRSGESLSLAGGDLEALAMRQTTLIGKGITDLQMTQNRNGDHVLHLTTPDNYSIDFIVPATHTFEELLTMYAHSPAELDEALVGLSDAEMDLTLSEYGWSIRQIVHHIADTDIMFSQSMKLMLSSPGARMERPRSVGNDRISTGLEYRDRPVATSVALFRTFHEHILDIVKYIPDAGEHSITESDGQQHTFSQMLNLINGHALEHIDAIWEIRRKHV